MMQGVPQAKLRNKGIHTLRAMRTTAKGGAMISVKMMEA